MASSRPTSAARFAAMAFYGAIEQVLTGWIFGLLPSGEERFEQAKAMVVETICARPGRTGARERPCLPPARARLSRARRSAPGSRLVPRRLARVRSGPSPASMSHRNDTI